jgi:hypothetical protein
VIRQCTIPSATRNVHWSVRKTPMYALSRHFCIICTVLWVLIACALRLCVLFSSCPISCKLATWPCNWIWYKLRPANRKYVSQAPSFAEAFLGWNCIRKTTLMKCRGENWRRISFHIIICSKLFRASVSQLPGRGPVPNPGINYTGPRESVILVF